MERAIRNALAKGDAGDRAFREKVYRSAFAALERTLQSNPDIGEELRARRRQALKSTVRQIETEYVPALAPDAPAPAPPMEPTIDVRGEREIPSARGAPAGRVEPDFGAEPVSAQRRLDEAGLAGERDEARLREAGRRGWSGIIVSVLLIAVLAGAGWWVWQSGLVTLPGGPTPPIEDARPVATDQPERPQTIQAIGDENWVGIFTPTDPATVTATGDTTAAVDSSDGQEFLQARTGQSGTPVRFAIGEGVLQRVAGGSAVFRISASADEEEGETQISVECSLAGLGDCGRRRFLVGITREDFLFEVQLPDARPNGSGTISINTDIEGQGRQVRIHSISVAPAR